MKKLTGPIVLGSLLLAHVGLLVATEESYTFRNEEYSSPMVKPSAATPVENAVFTGDNKPAQQTALISGQPAVF